MLTRFPKERDRTEACRIASAAPAANRVMATVTPSPKASEIADPDRGTAYHGDRHQGDDGAGSGEPVGQADKGEAAAVVVGMPVGTRMR